MARTSPPLVGEVCSTRGALRLHRQGVQTTLESNASEARPRDPPDQVVVQTNQLAGEAPVAAIVLLSDAGVERVGCV